MNTSMLVINRFFLLVVLLLISMTHVWAENSKEFAQHVVYYNAFPTDSLPSQMTKQYGLKRSKNYVLVNISVMKKGEALPVAIKSKISGQMKNLMGQSQKLEFREIKEAKAIYYIAQVPVQNKAIVNFFIDIEPLNTSATYQLKFSKKF